MAVYNNRQTVSVNDRTFTGATFSDITHTSLSNGAALNIGGSVNVTINGSTFYNNTLDCNASKYGGAVACESTGTVTITDTIFDSNKNIQDTADEKAGGGALYANKGTVNISGSTFFNNSNFDCSIN